MKSVACHHVTYYTADVTVLVNGLCDIPEPYISITVTPKAKLTITVWGSCVLETNNEMADRIVNYLLGDGILIPEVNIQTTNDQHAL